MSIEEVIRQHAAEVRFCEGQSILEVGEVAAGLHFILEGTVKQSLAGPNGQVHSTLLLGAGALVGEVSAVDGQPSQVNCLGVSEGRALFVSRSCLSSLMLNQRFLLFLTLFLSRKLRSTTKQLCDTGMRSVIDRLSCLLHDYSCRGATPAHGPVKISLSHHELAELLGVSRVTISQSLAVLKEQGLIDTGHRMILIHDPGGLRSCGDIPFCVSRKP